MTFLNTLKLLKASEKNFIFYINLKIPGVF